MKNFAAKINGEYFYAIPTSGTEFEFVPVPESEQKEVHEMIRYQQIDIYIAKCEEQSCEIVDSRIYDISSKETLRPIVTA